MVCAFCCPRLEARWCSSDSQRISAMELRRPERISAVKRGCSRQPLSAHQPNVERGYRASPQSAFEVSGHELVRSYVPDSPDVRPSKRM